MSQGDTAFRAFVLPMRKNRADERTRTADLILISLRVCGQWLPSVARVCKFRISKPFLVPWLAHYCRALRAG